MIVVASIHVAVSISAADADEAFSALANHNYARALEEFGKLADKGNAAAQYNLGVMHKNGKGVPQSYEEAAKWYRKAADQGHVRAQFTLGLMYYKGVGMAQDNPLAYMWASLAARQGYAEAQQLQDLVIKAMTPSQLADAQRLVTDWHPAKK